MIGYLDSKSDTVLKICTPQKFDELIHSQRTEMLVDAYRSGQNPDAKSQLPAVVLQGYDPNMLEKGYGSRKKADLVSTGIVMLDYDHLKEKYGMTPFEVHDKFLKLMPSLGLTLEHDLVASWMTASGDGTRLALRLPKGKTIAQYQKFISDKLGLECDKAVKDMSRLSFVPKVDDIFYLNKQLMFAQCPAGTDLVINSVQAERSAEISASDTDNAAQGDAHSEGDDKDASLRAAGDGDTTDNPGTTYPVNKKGVPSAQRPTCYHGVPYKDIVNKWIELRGGTPEPGDRHATLIALALDMRKITDNDKEWLAELMPDFGKGNEEKMSAIEWAVSQKPSMVNGTLKDVLKYFKILDAPSEASQGQNQSEAESEPPAMPDELPSLIALLTQNVMPHQKAAVATMVFPALSVYTNDAAFKLADNDTYELSMMSVLVGKQSVGKGCIDKPIDRILKRIEQQDKINRFRESEWKDRDRRRKSNERGEKKPSLPIRILNSDTTNAAFLMRLLAAEEGDGERNNLTTFTLVSEIESLYKFCSTGGSMNVAQTIKYAWDRKMTGADRVTSNAVCARTPLRWNFCASTTVGGAKKFFQKVLTDGVTSRIDFCTIIPPSGPFEFRYGDYTKEYNELLKPYIDNLENFRCEHDEDGNVIPVVFDRMLDIERQLDQHIKEVGGVEPDDTYEDYAYRAKVMAIKKLIILYIANGCQWEDAFEPFTWWTFKYGMWCKMNLFYDAAAEAFKDEQINGTHGGNKSPLKEMRRTFTYPEFVAKCQEQRVKQSPKAILRKYKQRGMIVESNGKYMINPEFATKWNIPG